MSKLMFIIIVAICLLLIDIYVYQSVRVVGQNWASQTKRWVAIGYWSLSGLSLMGFFTYHFMPPEIIGRMWRSFIMVALFVNYFSKLFAVFVLFIDDIIRGFKWLIGKLFLSKVEDAVPAVQEIAVDTGKKGITRGQFLSRTAIVAAAVPAITMGYGIISGAYDYRIRRTVVRLPNLPTAFDGIKIGHLSDIHSGSFFNKTAVMGGIEMLMKEKPDLIFFTGDLVNNTADEVKDYVPIFGKLKAPLGVFSTLGNHDYGDYVQWSSPQEKRENLELMKEAHRQMGWQLLMNENKEIKLNGDKVAILGVENWGKGGFVKHGRLDKAIRGTEEAAVKLLLSHDPSHWDAQVRPRYDDIDVMFSGHTHGFQFGIEVGNFKWSPAQYMYKQWAGLYQENDQYLYVNRGFGFLGFPGRIGMLPEITIMELKKA